MNGLYQISNLGKVRSLSRFHRTDKNYSSIGYYQKEKCLKPGTDGWGYNYVSIKGKNKRIHRLVAETFIPNPNNYEQVNHIDGNKQNNRMDNLEWCTREYNMQEAFKMGLVKRTKGEKHHLSKKVNQYDLSGNLIKEWGCFRDIQRELGFPHSNISSCCRGKQKTAYGYIWKYEEKEK